MVFAVGGVSAMVAYAVTRRMHEMAVRVALGARPALRDSRADPIVALRDA